MAETNPTEARKIRFNRVDIGVDPAIELIPMPFPAKRVLHWVPQFRSDEDDAPPPIRTLISQEILIAVNKHVSQSLEKEKGGFLLGNRYCDPGDGSEFIIIDQYVAAQFTESTAVSLSFTADSWMHLKEELSGKFKGKALVGWYHSHPRMDVFLSEFDLQIHEERFKEPWRTALVIEPEKRLGGFFSWRDGNINPRNPVEFYEYLSADKVQTKESVSPWVNYLCCNDATGDYYEPKRLATVLAPESKTVTPAARLLNVAPRSIKLPPPESLRRFVFPAILVMAIIISGTLAYYFFVMEPSGKTKPPAGNPSSTSPSPKKLVTDILRKIDKDNSKFRWIVERRTIPGKGKGKKRKPSREVSEPTGWANIYLYLKDVPENAKDLLEKNIVIIRVNDRSANKEYVPQLGDLEIQMKAPMPELINYIKVGKKQISALSLPIKIEFIAKGDLNPIPITGKIDPQDIPKALTGSAIPLYLDMSKIPLPEPGEQGSSDSGDPAKKPPGSPDELPNTHVSQPPTSQPINTSGVAAGGGGLPTGQVPTTTPPAPPPVPEAQANQNRSKDEANRNSAVANDQATAQRLKQEEEEKKRVAQEQNKPENKKGGILKRIKNLFSKDKDNDKKKKKKKDD